MVSSKAPGVGDARGRRRGWENSGLLGGDRFVSALKGDDRAGEGEIDGVDTLR